MTKEQVQALRDAGISEQAIIDRILGETAGAERHAEPEKHAAEHEKQAAEAAQPAAQANNQPDKADAILAAIDRLTGAIQAGNMRTGRDAQQAQSVEDIMASVLMPAKGKEATHGN